MQNKAVAISWAEMTWNCSEKILFCGIIDTPYCLLIFKYNYDLDKVGKMQRENVLRCWGATLIP